MKNKAFKVTFQQITDEGVRRPERTEVVKKTTETLAMTHVHSNFSYSYSVWPDGSKFTFEQSLKMDLRAQKAAGIYVKQVPVAILKVETL